MTIFEQENQEPIVFQRESRFGTTYVKLTGFHALLYRQMIWQYGKARATEKFWQLWHKKEYSANAEL